MPVRIGAVLDVFFEIIAVDLFDRIQRNGGYADIILDHQICKLFAVNQNDLAADPGNITPFVLLFSISGKASLS